MEIHALEINNLSYAYKGDWMLARFNALKNLSLTIAPGETFGFLGHNGAGKTTTIKCLLGLIRPVRGSIRIFGRDHRETEARRCVGYLPEQPYFYDHLRVRELLSMYASLAGVPRSGINAAVQEALELVKVAAKSDVPMRALSKGLTQRVALAQAILGKPRLLILDEPFSGLDPIGRREFRDIFQNLKGQGCTIFMSSHILADVEHLCDRVAILAYGEMKKLFALRELTQFTAGSYELSLQNGEALTPKLAPLAKETARERDLVRFQFERREQAEQALRTALESGARVVSYQFVHPRLEDLFVELVKFEEAQQQ